jgi:hypothetical protein
MRRSCDSQRQRPGPNPATAGLLGRFAPWKLAVRCLPMAHSDSASLAGTTSPLGRYACPSHPPRAPFAACSIVNRRRHELTPGGTEQRRGAGLRPPAHGTERLAQEPDDVPYCVTRPGASVPGPPHSGAFHRYAAFHVSPWQRKDRFECGRHPVRHRRSQRRVSQPARHEPGTGAGMSRGHWPRAGSPEAFLSSILRRMSRHARDQRRAISREA